MKTSIPFTNFRPITRRALLVVASLAATTLTASALESGMPDAATRGQVLRAGQPLLFEKNMGQTDADVRFLSRGSHSTLFLTPEGSTLVVRAGSKATALRMRLVGANAEPKMEGIDPLAGTVNSFIGSDPAQWRTQIPTYARAAYREVWPGVDLVYHGQQGKLEYDFVVAPGSDPSAIRMQFAGAEKVEVDTATGDLVLQVAGGTVRQLAPVTYQETAEGRREITSRYILYSAEEVGFEVADYDPALPLTIDPVLWYSTYWGGGFSDRVNGIAVDSSRNCYVTGTTGSSNFPRSAGPLDSTYNGNDDVFVSKFGPTNSAAETPALIYSTFLGGGSDDAGNGIAADSAGRAYVVGDTESSNFPTQAAMQNNLRGFSDAFVTKLDATGDSMLFSTYVGGFDADVGHGIAVRNTQVHIAGHTFSAQTFPVNGQYQRFGRGGIEAFVSKFTAAGNALIYSTLLGGGDGRRAGDRRGHLRNHVCDRLHRLDELSRQEPAGPEPAALPNRGPRARRLRRQDRSASTGENSLIYSTRLGGSSTDSGEAITVDSAQRAYVTGDTFSADFPRKLSQRAAAESFDAFVTKFNADGTAVFYSILLGGSESDGGRGIALDSALNPWVTGFTFSPEFPQSADRLQAALRPSQDPFVTQIVPKTIVVNGQTFVFAFGAGFSTLFGGEDSDGNSSEGGNGIAVDINNDIYFAGITSSTGFPLLNPRQTNFGGGSTDGFVAKIGRVDQPPAVTCTVATPSLWPPNGRLVNVGLSVSATDDHDPAPAIDVTVFSDETDVDTGGGAVVSPDAIAWAAGTLQLRAERQGSGDGRVYLILVTATDAAGNVGYTCCTVTVPHSQSAKAKTGVAAQAAAAEAECAGSGNPPAGYFTLTPVPTNSARR